MYVQYLVTDVTLVTWRFIRMELLVHIQLIFIQKSLIV